MPYKTTGQLPKGVKDNLPDHAQEIYKEAINSAWDQYDHDEERSHRVAWAAVKESYHKNKEGIWVKGATEE